MHPYYQQNEERLKRQMNAYLILVRLEIEQIFGKAYDEAFEEIWGYYRAQMLERCPYIGGDRSSGTKNLTGCLFFIAVGVCGKNHGLSTHEWGRLATTIYQRWFARLPRSTFSLPAGAGGGKYGAAPKGPQECEDRPKASRWLYHGNAAANGRVFADLSQQALSDQRFLPALWLYGVSAVYVQP